MRGTLALHCGRCCLASGALGSRAGMVRAALLSAHASVSFSEVGLMTRRVSKQRVEDGSHADNAGEMTFAAGPPLDSRPATRFSVNPRSKAAGAIRYAV